MILAPFWQKSTHPTMYQLYVLLYKKEPAGRPHVQMVARKGKLAKPRLTYDCMYIVVAGEDRWLGPSSVFVSSSPFFVTDHVMLGC